MHFEDDVVACVVGGQFHLLQRVLQVAAPRAASATGSVGAYHQVALDIVAARGTYGIYEALGIVVDGLIGSGGHAGIIVFRSGKRGEAPRAVVVEHLVVALEEQVLVVVLELLGNLFPYRLEAFFLLGIGVRAGPEPRRAAVARVVMHVQYAVHPLADDVVNHFVHTLHPCLLNLCADAVVGYVPGCQSLLGIVPFHGTECRLHVWPPRHGNAYGIESRLLHHLHQLGLGDGLSPCRFVCRWRTVRPCLNPHVVHVARVAVERIAQVPSHPHVGDSRCCRLEITCHRFRREHGKHYEYKVSLHHSLKILVECFVDCSESSRSLCGCKVIHYFRDSFTSLPLFLEAK